MTSGGVVGCGVLSRLQVSARSVWAKRDRDADGWLPLWRHMEDSAAVAGLLWDEWLPFGVRRLIAEALPGGEGDGRRLVVWLAGRRTGAPPTDRVQRRPRLTLLVRVLVLCTRTVRNCCAPSGN